MKSIVVDPKDGIYESTGDYVHAMEIRAFDRMLFVSGTMGLDLTGRPRSSLEAQLDQIWANIDKILYSAMMATENIVRITSYLRCKEYMTANERARLNALKTHRVPTTTIIAETLREDWLVEIEIIAAD